MAKKKVQQLIIKANEPFPGIFACAAKVGRSEVTDARTFDNPEDVVRWVADKLRVHQVLGPGVVEAADDWDEDKPEDEDDADLITFA